MLRSRSNHTAQLFRDGLFNHVLSFSFLASDLIKVEEKVVKERKHKHTYQSYYLPKFMHHYTIFRFINSYMQVTLKIIKSRLKFTELYVSICLKYEQKIEFEKKKSRGGNISEATYDRQLHHSNRINKKNTFVAEQLCQKNEIHLILKVFREYFIEEIQLKQLCKGGF